MASTNLMAVKVQKLIELINQTTHYEDTNLIDAINRLVSKHQEVASIVEAIAGEPGTINNPIVYGGNMKLEVNKYYTQDEVVYLCTKSSESNIYHPLTELVDVYVQKIE